MSQIPEEQQLTPEKAFEQLQTWFGMADQLAHLKTAEVLARKRMADFYFPNPDEGTNRLDLGGGFDLILVSKLNRTVDEAALMALDQAALDTINKLSIPMAELFVQKWELKGGAYNTLNDEQRKFVDALLVVKDATPALSIGPHADVAASNAHKAKAEAAGSKPKRAPRKTKEQAAPGVTHPVHLGEEADTPEGHFFRDAESVWWLLEGDEWVEVTTAQLLNELEDQWQASQKKPRGRRKAGDK